MQILLPVAVLVLQSMKTLCFPYYYLADGKCSLHPILIIIYYAALFHRSPEAFGYAHFITHTHTILLFHGLLRCQCQRPDISTFLEVTLQFTHKLGQHWRHCVVAPMATAFRSRDQKITIIKKEYRVRKIL